MLRLSRIPQPMKRLLIVGLALIALFVILEVGLRASKVLTENYYVWQPNLHWRFEPIEGAMSGVEAVGEFYTSSDGLRGEAYDPDPETIHILTIGDSTTESQYLDQSRTYPELLRAQLEQETGQSVWVGSAARSAMRSSESVLTARFLLPQLGDVDYLIAMFGSNDLYHFLRKGSNNLIDEDLTRGYVVESRMYRAFAEWPNPFHRDLEIVERINALTPPQETTGPQESDDSIREVGSEYIEWRNLRQQAAPFRENLPDLDTALAVYRRHLESLIRLAQQNDTTIVFVTQASLYAEEMTPEAVAMLHAGRFGEGEPEFLSAPALMEAFARYNEVMLDVCRDHDVLCVDAASMMNGNPAYFYDDVHFNYAGAEALAALLSEQLNVVITETH